MRFYSMRKKHFRLLFLHVLSILTVLCFSAEVRARYIEINPFLHKIPLAVSLFKTVPENSKLSVQSNQMLSEMLEFTGYFKIVDPGVFLEDPRRTGIGTSSINFQNWRRVGAELLITGGIWVNGKQMEMELRLFDVVQGTLLVGKRYARWERDMDLMLKKFAAEVIHKITGNWGIFMSKIAFVSDATGQKEIYICDFDGKNVTRFTNNRSINLSPSWASNGEWIAYTTFAKGKPDIHIQHIREKRVVVVAKKGINITPSWVPGQFRLSATLSFTGQQEIYLLSGNGEIIKKLTDNTDVIDTSASWSPDGHQMAFVSNRGGSPQVYVKDVQTGMVKRLTYEGNYNTQPAWSPKGDKIAYSSMDKNEINICVIPAGGGEPTYLTRGAGKNESPSWAPDGSMLVFTSTRQGPSRIYVMTAFGTDQRPLLKTMGHGQYSPSWSPGFLNQ